MEALQCLSVSVDIGDVETLCKLVIAGHKSNSTRDPLNPKPKLPSRRCVDTVSIIRHNLVQLNRHIRTQSIVELCM